MKYQLVDQEAVKQFQALQDIIAAITPVDVTIDLQDVDISAVRQWVEHEVAVDMGRES